MNSGSPAGNLVAT